MNGLVPISSPTLLALVAAGERARVRFLEFFAANIRNPNTRRAYYRAAEEFLTCCATADVRSISPPSSRCTSQPGSRRRRQKPIHKRFVITRHLDSPSYHCGVISLECCRHRETRTRPALPLPAVPTAESARHQADRRPAPARRTARAVHAHSPAAPLHHRAPGSRGGAQYRRSTNIREVRSDWSRDAR
jgi:hypothetical protein